MSTPLKIAMVFWAALLVTFAISLILHVRALKNRGIEIDQGLQQKGLEYFLRNVPTWMKVLWWVCLFSTAAIVIVNTARQL
jgi:hypothetical protein